MTIEVAQWIEEDGELIPKDPAGRNHVVWAPQPGSQTAFLACPIFEALYEGTRGPGKTDALVMDFAQDVGKGYGSEWRGILFRQTFPQLQDLVNKTRKWFPLIFPTARFNESKYTWTFETGETLRLAYMEKPKDYYNYHGHAYPWIGWEEMTTWPSDECYRLMMSCCRSTRGDMPRKYRSTTNPYGVGHNWVKARFRLPVPPRQVIGQIIRDSRGPDGELEPPRVAIHGDISENKILLTADPHYIQKIRASARNESELRAWLYGDWDVVAGGMFDDIWFEVRERAVVPRFEVPRSWLIDRSFDWGSSRPFSVGWWAESDGSDLVFPDGRVMSTVPGDLFRIHEWYGWSGKADEGVKMLASDIAKGIAERERSWKIHERVSTGVADSSIFDEENGNSIAADMKAEIRLDNGLDVPGIRWEPADKRPGSRIQGWEQVRKMMKATVSKYGPREEPGLFVVDHCEHFLRTVPTIPRSDKKIDDVDTDAEDHVADEVRYRVRYERRVAGGGRVEGLT